MAREELTVWPSEVKRLEGKISKLEMEREVATGDAKQEFGGRLHQLMAKLEAVKREALHSEGLVR